MERLMRSLYVVNNPCEALNGEGEGYSLIRESLESAITMTYT
jgi:hypothetical protein